MEFSTFEELLETLGDPFTRAHHPLPSCYPSPSPTPSLAGLASPSQLEQSSWPGPHAFSKSGRSTRTEAKAMTSACSLSPPPGPLLQLPPGTEVAGQSREGSPTKPVLH